MSYETLGRVKFLFVFLQIFALVTLVMSVVHEKYLATSSRQVKRNKKKSSAEESTGNNVYTPNDKERVIIITSLINRLKTELNTIDAAMGEPKLFLKIFIFLHNQNHHLSRIFSLRICTNLFTNQIEYLFQNPGRHLVYQKP